MELHLRFKISMLGNCCNPYKELRHCFSECIIFRVFIYDFYAILEQRLAIDCEVVL